MHSSLFCALWLFILFECLFFLLCKTYPVEDTSLSIQVKNVEPLGTFGSLQKSKDRSYSDENNFRRRGRKRRSDFGEEEISGERGPVEDIAAIKQIVDLLRSVGQRVIPIVMQGASVLNNLLSNLGT
ncbi:uncharacterized protein LOC129943119 [Eupeodes corollae]|uniref:uncharacterized protein LOC129943119 n=1 Tax=Eupeodes corollae TaxID=290404 RepID=UPI0024926FBF|nr:uncharacterized protein LOC129943119 [Eupeodes corollae]